MKFLLTLFSSCIFISSNAQQKLTSGGKLKPEQAIMDIRQYTIALDVIYRINASAATQL